MDRVTESFLSEFSEKHELQSLPQDRQFEHFAAYVTVRQHCRAEALLTADIHTGGGGDTSIDAIAVLVNGSLVTDPDELVDHTDLSGHLDITFVFVQGDRGASFEGKKLSDFGFGVKDFFDPRPRLTRNRMIQNAAEVMEGLYQAGTRFRPGNPVCRLYYVTTGTWVGDRDLEGRRKAVEADLRSMQIFRDVEFTCVGAERLQNLYRLTKNAVQREFTFSNRKLLPEISGINEAYIGFIPATEFIALVSDDDGKLQDNIFRENVRDWQKYSVGGVNEEIRKTIQSDHKDRFVVMNNGITMVARSLRLLRRDRIQIEDFQVVNGCQTTHVLFDQKGEVDDSLQIPLRLIATRDEEIVKAIVRGTNRQTKVEDDQFFALTDFADQLEDYFQTFPPSRRLYYERRSGQYERSAVHNTRVVAHKSLVRAVGSMFLEVPHQTVRSYRSLRDNIGKTIFAKGQRLEAYYVAAYALYLVNLRTQRVYPNLTGAKFHILMAMRYLANPAKLPRMNSHDMERYCTEIMNKLWDGAIADDLCAQAAALVQLAADGNFESDNIRTQSFTEKVIRKCEEAAAA